MPNSNLLHYCSSWECIEDKEADGYRSVYIKKGTNPYNESMPWSTCSLNKYQKHIAGIQGYGELYGIFWRLITWGLYVKIEMYEKSNSSKNWEEYELNTLMHELLHAVGVLHLNNDKLMNQHYDICRDYSVGKEGISRSSICYLGVQVFEMFRRLYTDSPHYWKDPAYQKKMEELETKRHEEQLLRELNCFHTPGCIPM